MGWLKCNVDGALFENFAAISVVFKDEQGLFMGGFVKPNLYFSRPEIVEAFGIREALSWICDCTRECVHVESDCLRVIQAINFSVF